MSEYKHLKEYYDVANIQEENIIINDITISDCGTVDIYTVEKDRYVFTITTARVFSPSEKITRDRIDKVILGESQVKKLLDLLLREPKGNKKNKSVLAVPT